RGRRGPGAVGRALRPVRRQAVHGRQHRRVHGRLVPPRDQIARRRAGLKDPLAGLGGEVYRRLGATPQTTPVAEILTSLQSGVLDAAEFVGPGTDISLGLYRVAPVYTGPGFNKPNGTGECIVSLKAWEALDGEGRAIVAHACAAEAAFALSEMERLNAEALEALTARHGVQLREFPREVVTAARKVSAEVLADLAARGEMARKVHDSYAAFR